MHNCSKNCFKTEPQISAQSQCGGGIIAHFDPWADKARHRGVHNRPKSAKMVTRVAAINEKLWPRFVKNKHDSLRGGAYI